MTPHTPGALPEDAGTAHRVAPSRPGGNGVLTDAEARILDVYAADLRMALRWLMVDYKGAGRVMIRATHHCEAALMAAAS